MGEKEQRSVSVASTALLQQLDAKQGRQVAKLMATLLRWHNPAPAEKRARDPSPEWESGSACARHLQVHEQDYGKPPADKKAKPDGSQGPVRAN